MWIFAYGSLIWNPGFQPQSTLSARLNGYKRDLCIKSTIYRGTSERPGLVFGLRKMPSTHCFGKLLKINHQEIDKVYDYLTKRELINESYYEAYVDIEAENGQTIKALTYIANEENVQFTTHLSALEKAQMIINAHGQNGPNSDYVLNFMQSFKQEINDYDLETIIAEIQTATKQ